MLLRVAIEERLSVSATREFVYQTAGAATGLLVQYEVFRPDKTLDSDQSGVASEIGTTGRYFGSFTCDGPGWIVMINDEAGGRAVKRFE